MKRLKRVPDSRRVLRISNWRRALWRAVWSLIILAIAGACLVTFMVFFTSAFKIRDVNFTGNTNVSSDRLKQLSGLDAYSNLVTLPVGRIARNIKTDPWVKDVKVQRRLPHTLNIGIVERKPVALLDYSSAAYLLEDDGYVIEKVPSEEFKELPRVYGGEVPPPVVGSKVSDKRVLDCVAVLAGMPQRMRDTLLMGNPFDGRGQVFVSRNGFNVVYGRPTQMSAKNQVLEAILADVKNNKRKIAYVDVRIPDSPVIKPL